MPTSANARLGHALEGKRITALAIDPITPTILYAGIVGALGDDGVFKSTDGGENWNAVNAGLSEHVSDAEALAIDPVMPTTLYAGIDNTSK